MCVLLTFTPFIVLRSQVNLHVSMNSDFVNARYMSVCVSPPSVVVAGQDMHICKLYRAN